MGDRNLSGRAGDDIDVWGRLIPDGYLGVGLLLRLNFLSGSRVHVCVCTSAWLTPDSQPLQYGCGIPTKITRVGKHVLFQFHRDQDDHVIGSYPAVGHALATNK